VIDMQLFLIRGLVAIVWAAVFAAAYDSLTTGISAGVGILLVIYPLIDVVASLIDARSQSGSARRLLLSNAAVSTVAAVAFGVASTGTVADALLVFGAWATVSGAAQLVTALRRRAQYGNQLPMLLGGGLSVIGGVFWLFFSTRDDATLAPLVLYAAVGGTWFVIQSWLLARRARPAVQAS
jgi:uncharacterized membrane protein HdeD (DUF308 family)